MPLPKKTIRHKRLIVDIGSGYGEFVSLLKERNPSSKVIGIDRISDVNARNRIKMSMVEFANKLKKPNRLEGVWLNHVNTRTKEGFLEFRKLVNIIPKKTPIFLTVRKSNLEHVRHIVKLLEAEHNLKIKSQKQFNPGTMIASKFTHKFYEDATKKGLVEMMPYRIVLMKE